jgi:PBSX family phage terminase large subunit
MDEYAFMRPVVWEEHIQPMLRESGGWAIFISTPNGFNHFYELTKFADDVKHADWEYFHFTAYDNPFFPAKEIDKARAETSPEMFAQEYMGDFTKRAGLVFPEFEMAVHVTPEAIQVQEGWVHFRSIDFGQTNPTAVLWIAVDKQGSVHVYDELYQRNLYTSELAHLIKAKSPNFISCTYGDSASAQSIKDISEHGIYVSPIKKSTGASGENYVQAGIEKIKQYLMIQEGTGKPKLFISPVCQNLIFEFMNYSWQEEKEDKNNPEKPQKFNDHALDALRYFIYEYSRPQTITQQAYVPVDSDTGY